MISSIHTKYSSRFKKTIRPSDWILKVTTTPSPRGPRSNDNEGVLHTSLISRTETTPSKCNHIQENPLLDCLTLLQMI